MFALILFGIILAASQTWSTMMTSNNLPSCVEPYLQSFEQSFAAQNYTPWTLRTYRAGLRCLGRLMDAEGVEPSGLTPDLADRLARQIPAGSKSTVRPHRLARRFAQHLIDLGVASPPPLTEAQVARAELFADYEAYLIKQRGLSPRTIYHTLRFANRFLDHCFGDRQVNLPAITATDAVAFVQHLLLRKQPFRDKTVGTHLRTFFQYLFGRGITATNLALCVPRATKRWNARLPRHLSPDEVEAVLASVQTNPRHGARDYAMLLVMARLGLRAPEVVAMQLDDIDWRAGELLVRGKGQRHDRLPIPPDVGDAISRYLRNDRISTTSRALFVTLRAPHGSFKNGQVVNDILKQAFAATGVKPPTPYVGSHVLRHSLATKMVRAGASLEEVGDMLRHRSRASTMIYAKLDIDGLRSIAQPWPVVGGVQ
jgi:integrase/recombinase XerD